MLQKGRSSYKKYHRTKMAPNINETSQKWHLTTCIIAFAKYYQSPTNINYPSTIRHRNLILISISNGKKIDLKIPRP